MGLRFAIVCLAALFGSLPGLLPAQPARSPVLPGQPQHARDVLSIFGIDESHLRQFVDGEPLGSQDEEVLLKILYRLPKLTASDLGSWRRKEFSVAELAKTSEPFRADTLRITGRAVEVHKADLSPEAAERLGFEHYFVVRVELPEAHEPRAVALVCVRSVPRSWVSATRLSEPVAGDALLLKRGPLSDGIQEVVLAANHLAWYPVESREDLGVAPDHVRLAQLGLDVSQLDALRGRDGRPFEAADSDCFYQVLAAVGRTSSDRDSSGAANVPELDLSRLLPAPEEFRARRLLVEAGLRRATKVLVHDPETQRQLGGDHYYQLDVFIPLKDMTVTLGAKTAAQQGPTFTNTFPATFCVRELPPGVQEGNRLQTQILLDGYFFRLWSYRSEYVDEIDPELRQTSPLFIGFQPAVVRIEPLTEGIGNWIVGGLVAGALGLMAASYLRRGRRADRRTHLPERITPPGESAGDNPRLSEEN